ncbi:MAG: prenyltransferase/squalene oxidase repeat-containing protein [Desulfobulbaceae bacterium]
MVTEQKHRNLFTATIPFVMERRKESGGFGATRRLPATIQDTYHALNILNLSREYTVPGGDAYEPTEDGLRAYLTASLRLLSSTGISTAFQLLWSCRSAGVEFDQGSVATAVSNKMRGSESLAEWYYCARILTEILGNNHLLTAGAQGLTAVLSRSWRCVDEAWMHVYLARALARTLPLPEPQLIAWFQASQNGDGGFGFFPGTTSFIENCHASLRALAFLGSRPLAPDRATLFLAGCRTAAGGFSRSGRAAPFLDATWHGLASLSFLSSMPS